MLEISSFYAFLKNPRYDALEMKETNVWKTAFKVFLITYVVFTLINGLMQWILGLFFTLPEDRLEDFFKSLKIGRWGIFFVVAILAPVIEEAIFRLPLVFKIKYISILFAILTGLIIHLFIPYLPVIVLAIPLYFIFSGFVPKHEQTILDIWVRYFRFVVWFSAIAFGLVHIGNFQLMNGTQYIIVPLLVIPQLGVGFVLSFVRLTYRRGFLIGLMVHMFINSVSSAIFLLQASTDL